jgi:hypothetical protein
MENLNDGISNDFDLNDFDFYLEVLIVLPQMVLPSEKA